MLAAANPAICRSVPSPAKAMPAATRAPTPSMPSTSVRLMISDTISTTPRTSQSTSASTDRPYRRDDPRDLL